MYTRLNITLVLLVFFISPALCLPTAPNTLPASNITTNSFVANWTSVSNATIYLLDVSKSPNFSSYVSGYQGVGTSGTSRSVTGLTPNTVYYYRVRVVVSGQTSSNSSSRSVTTLAAGTTALPAIDISGKTFTANWSAVGGATDYSLDVSSNNFSSFVSIYNNLTVTGTSRIVSGLQDGTIYQYRVRVNSGGTVSGNSNIVTVITTPVATTATSIASGSFVANWNAVIGSTGYQIDVATDPSFTQMVSGFNNLPVSSNNVTVSGLIRDGKYYYRVRAVSNSTVSPHSNTIAVLHYEQNYIRSTTTQTPDVSDFNTLENLSPDAATVNYVYADGLGYPMQKVNKQASPSRLDIVQPVVYDAYGREARQYLPFSNGDNGGYRPIEFDEATGNYKGVVAGNFYSNNPTGAIAQDTKPFSETIFDGSPLNTPEKKYGPGVAWSSTGADKFIKYQYLVNSHGTAAGSEKIIAWKIDANGMPVRETARAGFVEQYGYYSSSSLSIAATTDENGNVVREYTNKLGKVILKKVMVVQGVANLNDVNGWAFTYYIYDNFGNLRYVLQPELSKIAHSSDTYVVSQNDLDRLSFQYRYDYKLRLAEKRVPGSDWVYMVYDSRDRLVLTQDGNQRAGATNAIKYWSFTKYDDLNRPIGTGIKDTITSVLLTQAQMQAVVDNYYNQMNTTKPWRKLSEKYIGITSPNNFCGYSNLSYPVVTTGPLLDINSFLTVTYYDNYNFKSNWLGPYNYVYDALTKNVGDVSYNQPNTENLLVTGQVTGRMIKVLDGGTYGGFTWLRSINYYDNQYRVIQTVSDNYRGGVDRTSSLFDFTGKQLISRTTYQSLKVSWKDRFSLSEEGNKLTTTKTTVGWATSGAASVEQLAAGQDGWVEFVASETSTARMLGLSDQNTNTHYNTIDYAWYTAAHATPANNPLKSNPAPLYIYENGTNRGQFGTYVPGDVLRIERTGTTVKYYKNNSTTPVRTSTIASSSILMADAAFYSVDASLVNVRSSFSVVTKTVTRSFNYDHAGRLINVWHQIDNGPTILLCQNKYNEIGQLIDKKLHTVQSGADYHQSVDYRYNIRGWLTSINNPQLTNDGISNDDATDYFGMNLMYNNSDADLGNSAQFNGNISGIKWSSYPGNGPVTQKGYAYTYDAANRIKSSTYKEKTSSWGQLANNGFAETGYTYDLNGNLKTLQRNDNRATGWMDNLTYDYGTAGNASNKLLRVNDAGDIFKGFRDGNTTNDDYAYDANGNMTTDLNKGVTLISYNSLNLPEEIKKGGNKIRYIYDATGRKLSQIVTANTSQKQTHYHGELIFEADALQMINHDEGRAVTTSVKLMVSNDGSSASTVTPLNATVIAVTQNSEEQYLKITANGTTARTGIFPINGIIPVTAGERYQVRVKGYNTGTKDAFLLIKGNTTDLNWPGAKLPSGVENESWIEQIVTIPTGTTTFQVGLVWDVTINGEVMYFNELEINRISETSGPEYQYFLKDHLGNIRLAFTTTPETLDATATLEDVNQNQERGKFLRYENTKKVHSPLFDRTNGSADGYAQRLSGTGNEIYGLAKSLSVMPGDVINMEVYAKYVDAQHSNHLPNLTALLSQIATNAPGVVTYDGAGYAASTSSFPFASGLNGTASSTGTGPKAYINWLVFDKDYILIPAKSGYKRMTTFGREYGQNGEHELLSGSITIDQPGYVYIYLSNEQGANPYEVYFDDFKVMQVESPIVQIEDYYAFGLTFNSYTRENTTPQDFLFNGMEKQDELDLDVFDYGARFYDPSDGRWWSPDPLADEFYSYSPYNFSLNNPINVIDPDGRMALDLNGGRQDITSTFIGPDGKVIKHIDDDDHQVYYVDDPSKWDGESKEGLDIVGYEDPNKTYNPGDNYDYYNPREDPNWDNQYLIPASAYDYRPGPMPEKNSDDWDYLKNGKKGNYVTRSWEIFYRDLTAEENRETVTETALEVTRIGRAADKLGLHKKKKQSTGKLKGAKAQKHDKGIQRTKQKYNDKKRKSDNWHQNPNKR